MTKIMRTNHDKKDKQGYNWTGAKSGLDEWKHREDKKLC